MKFNIASLIISLFTLPVSLYYGWLLLVKVQGTELMWFLFWLMIPLTIFIQILSKLAEWEEKKS